MKINGINAFIAALGLSSMLVTIPAIAGHNHNSHNYQQYNNHNSHHQHRESRRHRSHNKTKHIIGGIIGGVILSNVFNNATRNHNRTTYVRTYNTQYGNTRYNNARFSSTQYSTNYPRYYSNPVVVQRSPTTTYRVLNGTECYLVNVNKFGNDILTQVPNLNCGF